MSNIGKHFFYIIVKCMHSFLCKIVLIFYVISLHLYICSETLTYPFSPGFLTGVYYIGAMCVFDA